LQSLKVSGNVWRMNAKARTLDAILRDPKRRRAWIIFQLNLRNKNLSDVARRLSVSRSTVYAALDRPYPRMENEIANELGMLASDLFPERYTDGIPNRVFGRPKKSSIKS